MEPQLPPDPKLTPEATPASASTNVHRDRMEHPVVAGSYQIMADSRHVSLDTKRIAEVATVLAESEVSVPRWNFPPYPAQGTVEELSRYMLTLNAINYCFFHTTQNQDGSDRRFSDGNTRGSTLAAQRLTEAWDKVQNADYLSNVTEQQVREELFHAATPIPLPGDRATHIQEVGKFLLRLEEQEQTFADFCAHHDNDAFQIASAVESEMKGFGDPFMKRSQLFVGLLYGRLQDDPACPISEESLSRLTVFADYRVPQTLIAMGVMTPREQFQGALDSRLLIDEDSPVEREFRAASIVAGDELMNRVNDLRSADDKINALGLDYLLWKAPRDLSRGKAEPRLFVREIGEHPRVVTTRY